MRRRLGRVFQVRHILVHELPKDKPYELTEIDEFLNAAAMFVEATDEELRTRLPSPLKACIPAIPTCGLSATTVEFWRSMQLFGLHA